MSNVIASRHDTPEKRKAYNRDRQRLLREVNGTGIRGKEFVAVDGEGGNDGEEDAPDTRHWYMLLAAGDEAFYTNEALSSLQCLNYLADLPVPKIAYVAFFFDYDVTMILRQLPAERIKRLLDRDKRTTKKPGCFPYTYPVDYMGYQIDYMPHKEFKVRRAVPYGEQPNPYVIINDVGSFFQCSFVEAITTWEIGTPAEREIIKVGKDKRASFQSLERETIEYNALELKMIAALMEEYRTVCDDIGYLPTKWQGPGHLATAMLKKHGIPKNDEINVPQGMLEASRAAYYGGRFETTAAGPIPGPVYAYDINSAYPDALTKLPCLIHGRWEQVDEMPEDGLYLAHGDYNVLKGHKGVGLFNFQHRTKKGSIKCPSKGSGWYWSVEIEQAVHQSFKADAVWVYVKDCACQPFDWVPVVYAERLKMGKSGRGIILKLALNSIYGKLVQSVGQAPYANPVWGSLITAMVRAKLMSISHGDMGGRIGTGGVTGIEGTCLCEHVYMLATDAVFTTVDLGIAGDKVLGGWDKVVHSSLFIIQPGLYFKADGTKLAAGVKPELPKTRGVPRKLVIEREQEFRDAFKWITYGNVSASVGITIPIKQFIGLRLASHRGKLETAGQWVWAGKGGEDMGALKTYDDVVPRAILDTYRRGKTMKFDWQRKRAAIPWREHVLGDGEMYDLIHTSPRIEDCGESTAYSKDIGNMLNEIKLESGTWDQPDWAPELKAYSNIDMEEMLWE